MAVLTTEEKRILRNRLEEIANANSIPQRWVKAAAEDAGQAVEDELQAIKATVAAAIDTATVIPYGVTFTNAEKKWIAAIVMDLLHVRDLV